VHAVHVGRPVRSTDMHSMHGVLGGRPAGRPKYPDCKYPTFCWNRSTDQSTGGRCRSTDRSTDSRVWGKNLLLRKSGYL